MAGLADYKPLRLMAGDREDLEVISACLQDAIAKLGDFAYIAEERRFAFVTNRFLWECVGGRQTGPFARVRAGVHFDDVISAQFQHLRVDAKDAVVEILSLRFEPGEDGAGALLIDFAGGGAIRLEVESINAYLSDISEPWRTRSRPNHEA
ncbi:MAG: DUF2948 family protein [Pseudomonadota bacterium]